MKTDWQNVTNRNAHRYIRQFADEIAIDELEMIRRSSGDCIVYFYGTDAVIKIPKKEKSRGHILKEARILNYLANFDLSITLPKVIRVHPEGLYAEYTRLKGSSLSREKCQSFSSSEQETFICVIAEFLSFLHGHTYPPEVIAPIPFEDHEIDADLERALDRVKKIQNRKPNLNVSHWLERLQNPPTTYTPVPITHRDFTFEHIYKLEDSKTMFGVIDFGAAVAHDPFIDFYELGLPHSVLDQILNRYTGQAEQIRQKVLLQNTLDDIRQEYKRLN